MSSQSEPTNMVIVTQEKGGSGKTLSASMLAAGGSLSGKKIVVFDVDPAVSSMSRRNGPSFAIQVDWTAKVDTAKQIYDNEIDGKDLTIIDLPAGFWTAHVEANQLIGELVRQAQERNVAITFLTVVSTNASGAMETAIELSRRFSTFGKQIIVLNNQDGSRNFGSLPEGINETVNLMNVPAGVVAAIQQTEQPLAVALTLPDPNYTLAAGIYAHRLCMFVSEPGFSHIFSQTDLAKIKNALPARPNEGFFIISTKKQASENALRANIAVKAAMRNIHDENNYNYERLVMDYRAALDAYHTALGA